jgi:hypothetical protein
MAGNITPIFSKVGDIQWTNTIVTANTTIDLTAGTSYLGFTADVTNGGYVQKVRFRSLGTNVATVARIWLNNGSATSSAINNTLLDEISLAATTVSQTSALSIYEIPLNIALPPGYKLYITIGTTVAAGYDAIVFGGKY